jgi:hypothetical protein
LADAPAWDQIGSTPGSRLARAVPLGADQAYPEDMAGYVEVIVSTVIIALVLKVLLAALLGGLWEWRSWRLVTGPFRRRFRRPEPPSPPRRPVQQIAEDARRISERYHQDGMRFAQYEGRRQAFDRVLAEAAEALEIEHLLDVLPPGPELDHERERVEARLVDAGLLPHPTPPE